MNIVPKTEAKAILEPHVDSITHCILLGWNDYTTRYSAETHLHETRTKANLIRDHIVYHARREFCDKPGVVLREFNGLFLVEVDGKLSIRFKKLDCGLRSSNIPTQQALAFNQQLLLPGIPPAPTRLNAGYVPNEWWTDIKGLFVVCPNGNGVEWSIEIAESESTPAISEFPMPTHDSATTATPRVRPRTDEALREVTTHESKR